MSLHGPIDVVLHARQNGQTISDVYGKIANLNKLEEPLKLSCRTRQTRQVVCARPEIREPRHRLALTLTIVILQAGQSGQAGGVRQEVCEPSQTRQEAADTEQGEQAEEGDGETASVLLLPRDREDGRQDASEPIPTGDDTQVGWFVCWCLEASPPLGLNTNSNPSLSYSAHKSFNINHNISTAQLFQTYTHTKPHIFLQNLKLSISQLKYFSTQNLL